MRRRSPPKNAYLVANARFHDNDFARLDSLKLLAEHDGGRKRVAEDFSNTQAIAQSDFLITYTCDLRPSTEQEVALRDFVSGGGKWIALHGTNAFLDFGKNGITCPRSHETFMQTLGSRFLAHPPIQPYRVTVSDPTHPLVSGMEAFDASDEIYLCEYYGEIKPLLETRCEWTVPSRGCRERVAQG